MSTTFLLIRHAEHDRVDAVLTGRETGVHLSPHGQAQAERLAQYLGDARIAAVQSSPRERALETAAPIAAAVGLPCQTAAALDEIDFGEWSGRSFDELECDPRWHAWNRARGESRPPGGENMDEVQARLVHHLRRLAAAHSGHNVVVVSHGDVIKAVLLHLLGAPWDAIGRIEIATASISTVVIGDWGGTIIAINERMAP